MVASPATLARVPFRDGFILAVEGKVKNEGDRPVPIRPFCDSLGLATQAQLAKFKGKMWTCVVMIAMQLPNDDRTRQVACLPLRALPLWLATINPSKVRPAVRPMLEAFQMEAADVLYQHFAARMTGQAADPAAVATSAEVASLRAEVAALRDALSGVPALLARLGAASVAAPAPEPTPAPAPVAPAPTPAPVPGEEEQSYLRELYQQEKPTWAPRIRQFFREHAVPVDLYGPDAALAITSTEAFERFSAFAVSQGWGEVHRYVFNVVMKSVSPKRISVRYRPVVLALAWVATEEPAPDPEDDEPTDIEKAAEVAWQFIQQRRLVRILPTMVAQARRALRPALRARVALDLLCTRGLLRRRKDGSYEINVSGQLPLRDTPPRYPGRNTQPRAGMPKEIQRVIADVQAWMAEETRKPTLAEQMVRKPSRGTEGNVLHERFLRWARENNRTPWNRHAFGCAMRVMGAAVGGKHMAGPARFNVWLNTTNEET